MRLLVIDFDSFFPIIAPPDPGWAYYDWGHSEQHSKALQALLWSQRAVSFLADGLPLPAVTAAWQGLWQRCTFTRQARLYVSDSNLYSIHPQVWRHMTEVVLLDAHHDAGYKETAGEHWTCDNWVLQYLCRGVPVTVRYPAWRRTTQAEAFCFAEGRHLPLRRMIDDGTPLGRFSRVHVCRSGAWVPPWGDGAFAALVAACPLAQAPQILEEVPIRPWPPADLDDEVARLRILLQQVRTA